MVLDIKNVGASDLQHVDDFDNIEESGIWKLTKDLKEAASTMTAPEARYLVDQYYSLQNDRIRSKNRLRAFSENQEPHEVIQWLSDNTAFLEKQIAKGLLAYAASDFVGQWSLSVCGIGPVIAAGLLAHIDIEQCPNVGHLFSFAGIAANGKKWEKGQKRPFNAKLKVLTWKIGESFVKTSGRPQDYYGKVYLNAKRNETAKNLNGAYAADATRFRTEKNYGDDTGAKAWMSGKYSPVIIEQLEKAGCKPLSIDQYAEIRDSKKKTAAFIKEYGEAGKKALESLELLEIEAFKGVPMLSPGHIHSRAKRKAVSLFLSHWWEVSFRHKFPDRECPAPYAIDKLGHQTYIPVHNNPFA